MEEAKESSDAFLLSGGGEELISLKDGTRRPVPLTLRDDNGIVLMYIDDAMKPSVGPEAFDLTKSLVHLFKEMLQENTEWTDDLREKICSRIQKGLDIYGHGIRVNDDTREYGTKDDSWLEMCEEEILDAIIYSAAAKVRMIRRTMMRGASLVRYET